MEASPDVFLNVPEKDHMSFFGAGTELKCERVADFLEFKRPDVSKASGVGLTSVRFDDRMPEQLKVRIREWAVLVNLVAEYFKGDKKRTHLWFTVSNPLLGDISPRDMIRFGRFKKLLQFVLRSIGEGKR